MRPLQEAQQLGCHCQHLGSALPQARVVVLVFVCENLCRAKEVFPLGYPNCPEKQQKQILDGREGQGLSSVGDCVRQGSRCKFQKLRNSGRLGEASIIGGRLKEQACLVSRIKDTLKSWEVGKSSHCLQPGLKSGCSLSVQPSTKVVTAKPLAGNHSLFTARLQSSGKRAFEIMCPQVTPKR